MVSLKFKGIFGNFLIINMKFNGNFNFKFFKVKKIVKELCLTIKINQKLFYELNYQVLFKLSA